MKRIPIVLASLSLLIIALQLAPIAGAFVPPRVAGSATRYVDDLADCKAHCNETIERRPAFIEIDANTGEVLNGTTKFAEGEKVQVIVSHKNPFKFAYRIHIVTAPLDTIIVSAFLKLIPGFGNLVDSIVGGALPPSTRRPAGTECAGRANAVWVALYDKAQPLTVKDVEIKKDVDSRNAAYKLYQKLYDETKEDQIKDCDAVCKDSSELSSQLGKLINLGDLSKQADQFKKDVDALQPLAAAFQTIFETLNDQERTHCDVKDTFDRIKAMSANAAKYADAIAKLQENQKAFQLMATLIEASRRSDAYTSVQYPYTAAGPTGVRITIFRKDLREENAQEKQVASIDLQVGESPFSISAGVGFSTIQDTRVIRQPFAAADKTIGARFGEENKSTIRPSAIVMLNASLKRFNMFSKSDGSLAVSTGLVLSNRNNTTEAEFIVGPSLGLLSNKLFFTFGYHAARVERVGGGFKIGDDVPAALQDPLPVEKNWKGGFMFAVTYKLR